MTPICEPGFTKSAGDFVQSTAHFSPICAPECTKSERYNFVVPICLPGETNSAGILSGKGTHIERACGACIAISYGVCLIYTVHLRRGFFVNPGLQNPVPICNLEVTKSCAIFVSPVKQSEFHSTDKEYDGYDGLKGFSNSFIRKTKNKYI